MSPSQSIARALAVAWLTRSTAAAADWHQGRYAGVRLAAKAIIQSGFDGKVIGHWFRVYRKRLA